MPAGSVVVSRQTLACVLNQSNFACKVCLKCWDMDYDNMLHCLDLPLLHVKRQHLKFITMFNIINGNKQSTPCSICCREAIHLYFTDSILASTTTIFHMYLMLLLFGMLYQ